MKKIFLLVILTTACSVETKQPEKEPEKPKVWIETYSEGWAGSYRVIKNIKTGKCIFLYDSNFAMILDPEDCE